MQAVQRLSAGVVDVRDVELGVVGDDEVLVDVLYAGVNPFDMQVLRGEIGDPSRELTLGAEATGTVGGVLVQVSGGGLGAGRDGTFAEQVVAPKSAVRELPVGADPALAATVGVAGKTAWHAVHNLAKVTAGDVVLVLGAAGGVGTFAAQLARAVDGVTVLAQTGSADKAQRLEGLGVTPIVAAGAQSVMKAVAAYGVSVVLDPLGGDYVSALTEVMRPGACAVTYGVLAGRTTEFDLGRFYGKGLRMIGTSGAATSPDDSAAALDGALVAVLNGTVTVSHEVLPLKDAATAFNRLSNRSVEGKLLLRPNS